MRRPPIQDNALDSPDDDTLPAAPEDGLLSVTAPLNQFSWCELFRYQMQVCDVVRRAWEGEPGSPDSHGDRLPALLMTAVQLPLERLLRGLQTSHRGAAGKWKGPDRSRADDFASRIAVGATSKATPHSRMACLLELRNAGHTELLKEGLKHARHQGWANPGLNYLMAEAERQDEHFAEAYRLCTDGGEPTSWDEHCAHRLRQLARICRHWRRPELALSWLRNWLERFPDSPDSGPVWLDRCVNAMESGENHLAEAVEALAHAQDLIGDLPVVEKTSERLAVKLLHAHLP